MFEYKHLLLLRDIWWSKLKSIFKCCSFFKYQSLLEICGSLDRYFPALVSNTCCTIEKENKDLGYLGLHDISKLEVVWDPVYKLEREKAGCLAS